MFVVPNGDHNTTYIAAGEEYFTFLRQFMKICLNEQSSQDGENENIMVEEQTPEQVEETTKSAVSSAKVEPDTYDKKFAWTIYF